MAGTICGVAVASFENTELNVPTVALTAYTYRLQFVTELSVYTVAVEETCASSDSEPDVEPRHTS